MDVSVRSWYATLSPYQLDIGGGRFPALPAFAAPASVQDLTNLSIGFFFSARVPGTDMVLAEFARLVAYLAELHSEDVPAGTRRRRTLRRTAGQLLSVLMTQTPPWSASAWSAYMGYDGDMMARTHQTLGVTLLDVLLYYAPEARALLDERPRKAVERAVQLITRVKHGTEQLVTKFARDLETAMHRGACRYQRLFLSPFRDRKQPVPTPSRLQSGHLVVRSFRSLEGLLQEMTLLNLVHEQHHARLFIESHRGLCAKVVEASSLVVRTIVNLVFTDELLPYRDFVQVQPRDTGTCYVVCPEEIWQILTYACMPESLPHPAKSLMFPRLLRTFIEGTRPGPEQPDSLLPHYAAHYAALTLMRWIYVARSKNMANTWMKDQYERANSNSSWKWIDGAMAAPLKHANLPGHLDLLLRLLSAAWRDPIVFHKDLREALKGRPELDDYLAPRCSILAFIEAYVFLHATHVKHMVRRDLVPWLAGRLEERATVPRIQEVAAFLESSCRRCTMPPVPDTADAPHRAHFDTWRREFFLIDATPENKRYLAAFYYMQLSDDWTVDERQRMILSVRLAPYNVHHPLFAFTSAPPSEADLGNEKAPARDDDDDDDGDDESDESDAPQRDVATPVLSDAAWRAKLDAEIGQMILAYRTTTAPTTRAQQIEFDMVEEPSVSYGSSEDFSSGSINERDEFSLMRKTKTGATKRKRRRSVDPVMRRPMKRPRLKIELDQATVTPLVLRVFVPPQRPWNEVTQAVNVLDPNRPPSRQGFGLHYSMTYNRNPPSSAHHLMAVALFSGIEHAIIGYDRDRLEMPHLPAYFSMYSLYVAHIGLDLAADYPRINLFHSSTFARMFEAHLETHPESHPLQPQGTLHFKLHQSQQTSEYTIRQFFDCETLPVPAALAHLVRMYPPNVAHRHLIDMVFDIPRAIYYGIPVPPLQPALRSRSEKDRLLMPPPTGRAPKGKGRLTFHTSPYAPAPPAKKGNSNSSSSSSSSSSDDSDDEPPRLTRSAPAYRRFYNYIHKQ